MSENVVYETGWLETYYDWAPSIIPLNLSNTRLFEKGSEWIGVSFVPDVAFPGKPWVCRDSSRGIWWSTRFEKAYCHFKVYFWDGDFVLSIWGGDDTHTSKYYKCLEDCFKDIAVLKSSVVTVEVLKDLGFPWFF